MSDWYVRFWYASDLLLKDVLECAFARLAWMTRLSRCYFERLRYRDCVETMGRSALLYGLLGVIAQHLHLAYTEAMWMTY